jgi:hypothetical protein
MRFLFIAFLIGHGLVHSAIWAAPRRKDEKAPFDPGYSWLVGERPALALALALIATALLVSAGVGLWAHADWWRPAAVAGAVASLVLAILYFNPWLLLAVALDVGLIVGIVWLSWPPNSNLGA